LLKQVPLMYLQVIVLPNDLSLHFIQSLIKNLQELWFQASIFWNCEG
jgi:hypothetical protein